MNQKGFNTPGPGSYGMFSEFLHWFNLTHSQLIIITHNEFEGNREQWRRQKFMFFYKDFALMFNGKRRSSRGYISLA